MVGYDGEVSPVQLTTNDAPFSAYGTIPIQPAWMIVHADGKCRAQSAPSDSTTEADIVNSTTDNTVRERLGVDPTKDVAYVEGFWTRGT